jgi:hypothetical protein
MPFTDTQTIYQTANVLELSSAGMKNPDPASRPVQLGLVLPKNTSASQIARHVLNEILDKDLQDVPGYQNLCTVTARASTHQRSRQSSYEQS